jgi:hypothetical protein
MRSAILSYLGRPAYLPSNPKKQQKNTCCGLLRERWLYLDHPIVLKALGWNYEPTIEPSTSYDRYQVFLGFKNMTKLLDEAIAQVRQLPEAEQNKIAAMLIQELESREDVFWDEFEQILEECQMNTGIFDLSYQHDHYIHGLPKRELE